MMSQLLQLFAALGLTGLLSAPLIWYLRTFPRTKELPAPVDPIEAEALRLARQEIEEFDWRLGTGEKPEHLVEAERKAARIEREKAYEESRKRLWEAAEKHALDQADKAAADLLKLQSERDVEDRIIRALQVPNETLSVPLLIEGKPKNVRKVRVTKAPEARSYNSREEFEADVQMPEYEIELVVPPSNRAHAGAEHYVQNARGEVVMAYTEPCVCPECMRAKGLYPPRPRKAPPIPSNKRRYG